MFSFILLKLLRSKKVLVGVVAGLEVFLLLLTLFAPILSSNFIAVAEASSGIPTILSYQGRLADASGNLLGGLELHTILNFQFGTVQLLAVEVSCGRLQHQVTQ